MGDRLRPLWDFDDLNGTERRFRERLAIEPTDAGRAEVLTQLARVHGLREQFAEGDRLLDDAAALGGEAMVARARIDLERGRIRRSGGDSSGALPLFVSAFQRARDVGEDFLAADAAHMAALAAPTHEDRLEWTNRGIEIAQSSPDRDVAYWLGPLLNNLGCEFAALSEHEAALDAFERALEVRLRYPENPQAIQWARESVEEALQALGRKEPRN
jgi:tetratricopeptide (TPR) repeat protein